MNADENPVLPVVYLNGTGAQTLFDDALAVRAALHDAKEVLKRVEFNARDYPETWEKARAQRAEMFRLLNKWEDDILLVAAHVQALAGSKLR